MSPRRRRDTGDEAGLSGLLLVDKPQGPTSFDVVAEVRRALHVRRVGHTGTLDPMATGLLPLLIGPATRLVAFLTEGDKTYRATLRLGVGTDTLDAEGQVIAEDEPAAVAAVDPDAFEAAIAGFLGPQVQTPPMFSAIKVQGERLYAKARRGETVVVPPRDVIVHRLALVEASPPDWTFDVACSKGTYVRSLGRDIAATLGLSGHLVALRRTSVGALHITDALPLATVIAAPDVALAALRRPADAVAHLPTIRVDEAIVAELAMGRRCAFPEAPPGRCRVLDEAGRIVAVVCAAGPAPAVIERGFPRRNA